MSATPKTTTGRTKELEFEINAKVEDVWAAISEADHLMNWFPLNAEVTPGKGGTMRMSWGVEFDGECTIEIWEPNSHLRSTFIEAPEGAAMRTHVDYFLEGDGGKTKLRLVHSGFGEGADWDNMYDSISHGWAAELRSLKHYMEHHFGTPRHVAWASVPFKMEDPEAWSRITSDRCLGIDSVESLEEGGRFTANGPALGSISGKVLLIDQGRAIVTTIDERDNAYLRVELARCGMPEPSIWFWVSDYSGSEEQTVELIDTINSTLEAMLG